MTEVTIDQKRSAGSALLYAFFALVFGVFTDLVRAFVFSFIFNAIVAPALGLPLMTVMVAYIIDLLFGFLVTPMALRLAQTTREVMWRPMVDDSSMRSYLKASQFTLAITPIFLLLCQAAIASLAVYLLGVVL